MVRSPSGYARLRLEASSAKSSTRVAGAKPSSIRTNSAKQRARAKTPHRP